MSLSRKYFLIPKESTTNEDPQELQDSQWLLPCKKIFLAFIWLSGWWDKFSFENFGLGKPCFHATIHLKIEVKEFFP